MSRCKRFTHKSNRRTCASSWAITASRTSGVISVSQEAGNRIKGRQSPTTIASRIFAEIQTRGGILRPRRSLSTAALAARSAGIARRPHASQRTCNQLSDNRVASSKTPASQAAKAYGCITSVYPRGFASGATGTGTLAESSLSSRAGTVGPASKPSSRG